MQVITETELLERIAAFRGRHDDKAPTTFGRKATGNANLIKELEEGKSPSLRTVQRIAEFMDRADAEARLREKLSAPLEETPVEEVERQLPFQTAPVKTTGASSPTSSSTNEPSTSSAATGSCPASSTRAVAGRGATPNLFSSADRASDGGGEQ